MSSLIHKSFAVAVAALVFGPVLAAEDLAREPAWDQVKRTMVVDYSGKPPFKRHFVDMPTEVQRADFARFEQQARPDARLPMRSAHRGLSRPASPR